MRDPDDTIPPSAEDTLPPETASTLPPPMEPDLELRPATFLPTFDLSSEDLEDA